MSLTVEPISGEVGAEIGGVDLAKPISDREFAEIKAAFVAHHVLLFRNQGLTPTQQMNFAKRFGPLDVHPFVVASPEHPEVLDVITEPDDKVNSGGGWHTDLTFLPQPDLGSVLYDNWSTPARTMVV